MPDLTARGAGPGFARRGLLSAGGAGLVLAACGRSPRNDVLRVASQKGGTKSLVVASGVLAGASYAVEWSEFPAAQNLLEAVGSGAADLGAVGDAPFLFAYAAGSRVRAVQAARSISGGGSTALLVQAESPFRTIRDLVGRKVATGRGSIGHYLLLVLLEAEGLSPKDLEIAFLSPSDAGAAFSTGAIDGWATWGSYVHVAVRDGGARVLADGRGRLSGVGYEVANLAAIEARRSLIADFLHRLSGAQRWGVANAAAYAAVLSRETGLDPEIAELTVANGGSLPIPIGPACVAEARDVLRRFRASGELGRDVDPSGAFDASFAAAVAA